MATILSSSVSPTLLLFPRINDFCCSPLSVYPLTISPNPFCEYSTNPSSTFLPLKLNTSYVATSSDGFNTIYWRLFILFPLNSYPSILTSFLLSLIILTPSASLIMKYTFPSISWTGFILFSDSNIFLKSALYTVYLYALVPVVTFFCSTTTYFLKYTLASAA